MSVFFQFVSMKTAEKRTSFVCRLKEQGFRPGSCSVEVNGKHQPACAATLKDESGTIHRLITSIHLSRPENYLSLYQSGCNFSCRKCHSWYFSKVRDGKWYTADDIAQIARAYERQVTLIETREHATAWHAHDTCRCCGSCVVYGERSPSCPGVLKSDAIVLSPQGFGPARNIVAFTGGDVTCCPEFYGECAKVIKEETGLWVLIETNGYGLTHDNLGYLRDSGVDSFWLDIKAFDDEKHKWLTGCSNVMILTLPEEIVKRDFILEVLSLYIPGLVEEDQLEMIARSLAAVDPATPFTILAFFPDHRMKAFRKPTVEEMVTAYQRVQAAGLRNIRLGNLGVFAPTRKDLEFITANVDPGAF